MEKRYQVFISSTYVDLQEERREVIQALLELDCIPAGMELFPAANEDQWSLINKVIDDCDYYIVIIGGRYGSESDMGISYTQMEYDYALQQKKPILGFVHRNPGVIPVNKSDLNPEKRHKLDAFRSQVCKKHVKHWESAVELGSVVSRGLVQLIKAEPAVGWVKADIISESATKDILSLRKRIDELEQELNRVRNEAPIGTETLAQGDDMYCLKYSCSAADERGGNWKLRSTMLTTWSQIFAVLAPVMLDEAPEAKMKRTMRIWIGGLETKDQIGRVVNDEGTVITDVTSFDIEDDDFQSIKIQFLALGLIMKGKKPRSVKESEAHWVLTPYGENVMIKLRALQRDPPKTA